MKRPIAMLLSLLLTAGLFAFVSCGEEKNYTVKEVNGRQRIFLDQSEIDRIYRELDEQGYSQTLLKDFVDVEYSTAKSVEDYTAPPSATRLPMCSFYPLEDVSRTEFIAKCRAVGKRETWRLDYIVENTGKKHFATVWHVYSLKIEKLYRTDGDEKEGDIIRIACNYWNESGSLEEGFYGAPREGDREPTIPGDVYYIMMDSEQRNLSPKEIGVYDWRGCPYRIIHQIDRNTYAMDDDYKTLINNGNAYPMPNEDKVALHWPQLWDERAAGIDDKGVFHTNPYPSNYDYYVDIKNFDEVFQAYLDKFPPAGSQTA